MKKSKSQPSLQNKRKNNNMMLNSQERELNIAQNSFNARNVKVPEFSKATVSRKDIGSYTKVHENRFIFNPRDVDYVSLTRYRYVLLLIN